MKQIILIILLFITFSNYSSAQKLPELEKVKEIKLLESTRDDVRRILAEYKVEKNTDSYQFRDTYSSPKFQIKVSYSEGMCNEDSSGEDWNVGEWKVILIEMIPKNDLNLNDVDLNLSNFKKENVFTTQEEPKLSHRKDLGILIETTNNKIDRFLFVPAKKLYFKMCDHDLAKRLTSTSSYFDPENEERSNIPCIFTDIKELVLQTSEIVKCNKPNCSENIIPVKSIANNDDGGIYTYNFLVTGGKIIGQGDKVFWDLSGVKPGTYTITAAIDNGCGFCGKTITKSVMVKECADCNKP